MAFTASEEDELDEEEWEPSSLDGSPGSSPPPLGGPLRLEELDLPESDEWTEESEPRSGGPILILILLAFSVSGESCCSECPSPCWSCDDPCAVGGATTLRPRRASCRKAAASCSSCRWTSSRTLSSAEVTLFEPSSSGCPWGIPVGEMACSGLAAFSFAFDPFCEPGLGGSLPGRASSEGGWTESWSSPGTWSSWRPNRSRGGRVSVVPSGATTLGA